jgi:hypothetical protein
MHTLMGRLGYQKRSPALFAMASWRQAVGDTVARHAVPERVERDVLHVVVDGASWANELRWMESALVSQLNAACGRQAVSRLRFRIGTLPKLEGEERTRRPSRTMRTAPPAEIHAEAARLANAVQDAELAASWQRLVTRGLMRHTAAFAKEDKS